MIYICADDYGLDDISSMHIQECIQKGALNKISVFPNFMPVDFDKIPNRENIRIALHLNLVEGRCLEDASEIPLIADKNGIFKHTFLGLLAFSIFHKKEFEKEIYKEIKAQVLYWKNSIYKDTPFCVDSHQHTHMIPAVFKALVKVLEDEKIQLEYIRIPKEPVWAYIRTPSLYFTYSPVNIIKQWLLNFLCVINRKHKMPTSYFLGILFSGKMDEKRVSKVLPKYIKMAEKHQSDIEVLFHPGFLDEDKLKNIVFKEFYLSENRKTEFDSVMKLSERGVL